MSAVHVSAVLPARPLMLSLLQAQVADAGGRQQKRKAAQHAALSGSPCAETPGSIAPPCRCSPGRLCRAPASTTCALRRPCLPVKGLGGQR